MKITDTFKLVKHEYHFGKPEWVSSILMHTVIMTCILFTVTIALEISHVCSDYMSMSYTDGYIFYLKGFSEGDSDWLEKREFTEIYMSSEGPTGIATIGNLEKIWLYKFEALFQGKDLWNEEVDQILEIILLGHIVFAAIAGILFMIMVNSNSNALSMKLDERKKYIIMLMRLGAAKRECIRIFTLFFALRGLAALILSVCLNALIIRSVNRYIVNVMHIKTAFSIVRPVVIIAIAVLNIFMTGFSLGRIWRKKNAV